MLQLSAEMIEMIKIDEEGRDFMNTIYAFMHDLDPENLTPAFYLDAIDSFNSRWPRARRRLVRAIDEVSTDSPAEKTTNGPLKEAMNTCFTELSKARSKGKRLAKHCRTWLTLSESLQATGAMQRKTAWNADFKRLVNASDRLIEETLLTDIERDKTLLACSIERGLHLALTGAKTYGWQSEVKVKVMQALTGDFVVNYEDSQRGQQSSIAGMLEVALGLPGLTNDISGLDFSQAVPKEIRGSEEIFEILATVLAARKMLPIANNGSNSLFSWDDTNSVLPLLDSMFDDISQAAAYGLGFLNGSLENILGMGEELHDNILKEVDGRKVLGMVYDSTMLSRLGFLKKPDGSTLNNFTCPSQIGQTRYMLKGESADFAAFGKGQQANARFTILPDGRIASTGTIKNLRTDSLEGSFASYTEQEITTIERLVDDLTITMEDLPEAIAEKAKAVGDFVGSESTAKDSEQRMAHWDSWFESNKNLPWIFGIEKGQIKGKAKHMFDKLVPSVNSKIGKALEQAGGHIVLPEGIKAHGVIIIKSPSQSISSTSLNFQPQAILLSPEEAGLTPEGQTAKQFYTSRTDAEMASYTRQAIHPSDEASDTIKEIAKAKLDFFDRLCEKVGASEATIKDYPKALMGNVGAGMWRWFTNFHKTDMPTRRVLMHKFSYRGFLVVDDDYTDVPVQVASWRGPLIAFSAIQAPIALNRKVAARLLDGLSYGNSSNEDKQAISRIKERLEFKNPDKEITDEHIMQLLNEVVSIGTFIRLDDSIMVIDERDLVDMQGDDDGDTVTIDKDDWIVRQFVYTEKWWTNFVKANGLCNPRLEMPKSAKIDFSVGKRLVLEKIRGKESEAITTEESEAILHSGTYIPGLAESLGLPYGKIPRLTGFTFGELLELNTWTEGRLFGDPKWFAPVCKVLGSNPAGPIGAPSNCAPDILIKALANTEDDGITLTPLGRFLYQFYQNSASQTQVSIDFGKRIVEIMAGICADHQAFPKFDKEITPDMMGNFLAKKLPETYTQVVIQAETVHKVIRVVEANDLTKELFSPTDLLTLSNNSTPTELFDNLNGMHYYSCEELDGFLAFIRGPRANPTGLKVKATNVTIKDPSNGCYDFASIYAYAQFALGQIASSMLLQPAVWKPGKGGLMELLTTKKDEVVHSFEVSSGRSALVSNALSFFDYFDSSSTMHEIMTCTSEFVETAKQNANIDQNLLDLWPSVKASVAQYFNQEYKIGQKKASKRSILKAIYKGLGLSSNDVNSLELQESVLIKDLEVDIFDILSMLVVCDDTYLDDDIPQTTWQVLVEEFVKAEDPTVFDEHIIPYVDAAYEEDAAFLNAVPIENTKNYGTVISTPTAIINYLNEPFKEVLLRRNLIVEKEGKNNSTYYSYTDAKAALGTAAEVLTLARDALLLKDEDFHFLDDYSDELLSMFDESPLQGARDVVFGIKAAFKPYNDSIRYLQAMLKIDHLPVDAYTVGGNGTPRLKSSKGPLDAPASGLRGLPPRTVADGRNLFATSLTPKNIILSLSKDHFLPDPQVNRTDSWEAIYSLAEAGCLVKSYSYFGNAGWKDPTTIRLIELVQSKELCVNFHRQHGLSFNPQDPRTNFSDLIRSMSFLNLLGTSNSEYHSFNNFTDTCRYPGVEEYVDLTPAGRFRLIGSSLTLVDDIDEFMKLVCQNTQCSDFGNLLNSFSDGWALFQDLLSDFDWDAICNKHQQGEHSQTRLTLYGSDYTEYNRETLIKRLSQIVELGR